MKVFYQLVIQSDMSPYLHFGQIYPLFIAKQVEATESPGKVAYLSQLAKKILEWSQSSEQAFMNALYLNNKYELDGRDPNSDTRIAWCFGKHDRPWNERKIFGKVRYMNDRGFQQ